MEIDSIDRVLLRELQNDARQTNRDLAAKTGVSPSTSLERVRLLRDRGVITGYHVAVDLEAVGRPVHTERHEVADVHTTMAYEHVQSRHVEPAGTEPGRAARKPR